MRILMFCLLCSPLFAQDLINQIIDGNPFDPARGHKDIATENDDAGPLVPADLPLCDGTLILGQLKYALLTFRVEGEPSFKSLQIGEESNGYKVAEINYDKVVLNQAGMMHTITLFQQNAKKEQRGGSRKSSARKQNSFKKPPSKRASKKAQPNKDETPLKTKTQPKIIKKSTTKPNKKTRKIDF